MKLSEMIAEARAIVDDQVRPYLWSDDDWKRYANKRQREAARRARLIVDSTSDFTEMSFSAGDVTVDLDPRIVFVRRARVVGRSAPLQRVSQKDLDCHGTSWEDDTGEPRAYVPDMDTAKFRPFPTPDADYIVKLMVVRLPLEDLKADADVPEIAPQYHDALIEGMVAEAYLKQDAETFDKTKAAVHEAAFEAEFGKKSSAIDEVWLQREHDFVENEGNF